MSNKARNNLKENLNNLKHWENGILFFFCFVVWGDAHKFCLMVRPLSGYFFAASLLCIYDFAVILLYII